ncbi:MAG: Verru_Chthon cassette protein A, partial [Chthoniobacteraceae bacterium]|nr:Verru_Chthon cassette protein A [Chthoniobacteraceae bacterium]
NQVYALDWTGKIISGQGPYNYRYLKGRLNWPLSGFNSSAWFLDQDVIRSVSASPGDIRLIAARKTTPLPGNTGYPFEAVNAASWRMGNVQGMHTFFTGNEEPMYGARLGRLVAGASYDNYNGGTNLSNSITAKGAFVSTSAASIPLDGVAVGKNTALAAGDLPGDWDNGPSSIRDGPYINKPDEGDKGGDTPYSWKGRDWMSALTASLFTPNRQIPSAVMFGSLSTGVMANRPWQTLLFHPDPSGLHPGSKDRKGDGSSGVGMPADHLWLDLFNMPVVEPYAISEPLSTAGRINMNYQIAPFTYLTRETGVRAVLKSEKVIAIADSQAGSYKLTYGSTSSVRLGVNADETLKGFAARFTAKELFRSASEICTLPIVPTGATYDKLADTNIASNYWTTTTSGHRLTGDNSRERPYATIYPRLTTKSNTFTVHVRVQVLKKSVRTPAASWDEGKDSIASEYRGSQTIERYVDPNDAKIPDFADPSHASDSLNHFYQLRVLSTRRFTP